VGGTLGEGALDRQAGADGAWGPFTSDPVAAVPNFRSKRTNSFLSADATNYIDAIREGSFSAETNKKGRQGTTPSRPGSSLCF